MKSGGDRSKRVRIKPGDVFAVPRDDGGYSFIIYITDNRWGDAFGIVSHRGDTQEIPPGWDPVFLDRPAYTGTLFARNGRWAKVGHREDLLQRLPGSPPLYHSKQRNPNDDKIGPYGTAEFISGDLRDLTEAEADEIGLTQGTYKQLMLEEQFEDHLQTVVK